MNLYSDIRWLGVFLQGPWYQPILAGIIVYFLAEKLKAIDSKKAISVVKLAGLAAAITLPALYQYTQQYSYLLVFYLPVFCAIIVLASALPGRALLGTKPLAWIGLRSYGLYLAHMPCSMIIREVMHVLSPSASEPAWYLVALSVLAWALLTFGVTEILYRHIEKPFTEYGRRPFRQTAAPAFGSSHDGLTRSSDWDR